MRSSGATSGVGGSATVVNTTQPPSRGCWTSRRVSSLPGAQLRLRLVPKKDDFYQHYHQRQPLVSSSSKQRRSSKGSTKQLITGECGSSGGAATCSSLSGHINADITASGSEESMEMKTPPQTRLTMVHQAEVVINQVSSSRTGGGRCTGFKGGRHRRAYI